MTDDLLPLVVEYRAGLDAELALLRRLDALSTQQQEATAEGDPAVLRAIHDARDRVMGTLVSIEHDLRALRAQLAERRDVLAQVPAFQAVAALHTEAAEMVARIITSDQTSLRALERAEQARRVAASAMERGEVTLQAYRRVVAPPSPDAALVDRRG